MHTEREVLWPTLTISLREVSPKAILGVQKCQLPLSPERDPNSDILAFRALGVEGGTVTVYVVLVCYRSNMDRYTKNRCAFLICVQDVTCLRC